MFHILDESYSSPPDTEVELLAEAFFPAPAENVLRETEVYVQ